MLDFCWKIVLQKSRKFTLDCDSFGTILVDVKEPSALSQM